MKYPLFKIRQNKKMVNDLFEKVMDSGYVSEGGYVEMFKSDLHKFLKHENVVLLNSCTSALTVAMKLAGVGPGKEVITVSQTCLATNVPILHLGGSIVWADIEVNSGVVDVDDIINKITNKTVAIVFVNWTGNLPNLSRLKKISEETGIKVIQDAAQSFGAEYYDLPVCHFADYTCYSFQAIKHLTCGDGGALVCKSDEDYKRASRLKWFGINKEEISGNYWDCDVAEAGYKFNMNNISAIIGMSQIGDISKYLSKYRKNAERLTNHLRQNILIHPLERQLWGKPSYWVYDMVLDECYDRDKIMNRLNEIGIQSSVMHTPNHYYSCFPGGNLPKTSHFNKHHLCIPCGWWLNSDDIDYIAEEVMKNVK